MNVFKGHFPNSKNGQGQVAIVGAIPCGLCIETVWIDDDKWSKKPDYDGGLNMMHWLSNEDLRFGGKAESLIPKFSQHSYIVLFGLIFQWACVRHENHLLSISLGCLLKRHGSWLQDLHEITRRGQYCKSVLAFPLPFFDMRFCCRCLGLWWPVAAGM